MQHSITADAVEAYVCCPRKAFLLLHGGRGAANESGPDQISGGQERRD
jgi:hypothetical protein